MEFSHYVSVNESHDSNVEPTLPLDLWTTRHQKISSILPYNNVYPVKKYLMEVTDMIYNLPRTCNNLFRLKHHRSSVIIYSKS